MENRGVLAIVAAAVPLAAAAVAQEPDEDHPEAADANKLAQMLANPVANLWSLQFQFNNFQLTNDRWNSNLNFQPVMPVSLTKDVNLITRLVIQVYNSVPYETSTGEEARTTNFGDWNRHRSRQGRQVRASAREDLARRAVDGHAARSGRPEVERPDPADAGAAQADQGNPVRLTEIS